MLEVKLNKIGDLIDKTKIDVNLPIISDFLEWFLMKLDIHFNKKISQFVLNKGEIYFVNLGKNIGSELNKTRPCFSFKRF